MFFCPDGGRVTRSTRTLVANLKNRPENLVFLLSLVRRILCVLHFIAKLQQGIFYVVEACWWGFAIAACAYGRHGGG